jgi:uncharacterized protein YjbI with pentapeptide repeats
MAILYTAVLDHADFRDAELFRAVLIGARGIGTIFTKANLNEIHAPNTQFHHAQFNEATMETANLVAADLHESNFTHANLAHANLQEANLRGATLSGADLTGAQLDTADLHRATLHGANLASVRGLTQTQLNTACVDEHTTIPMGLSRPPRCVAAKKAAHH